MFPAVDGKQTFEASLLKTEGHATTPRKEVNKRILRHIYVLTEFVLVTKVRRSSQRGEGISLFNTENLEVGIGESETWREARGR